MGLSLVGIFFVVRAYDLGALDALGVAAGLAAAVSFAIYLAGSERAGERNAAATTLVWAFGFATLFWLAVQPPWTFPFEQFSGTENLLLAVAVIVVGTVLPYGCLVAAVPPPPAARAGGG